MGSDHPMRRPPKFVNGYIDRHGKPRFYFRRKGFKKIALPGFPWSPEFMAAYERAMAGQPPESGSKRTLPGSIRALAASYYNSLAFRSMKPITQTVYRNIIDRFCRETDRQGQEYGDKSAATLQREHIIALMAQRADKPDSANGLRKVLRAMMTHAVEIRLRADDPTQGVKKSDPNQSLVSVAGPKPKSRSLRNDTRSAASRGLPLLSASIPDRPGRMSSAWVRSTLKKKP
jgi:hypothetical protein